MWDKVKRVGRGGETTAVGVGVCEGGGIGDVVSDTECMRCLENPRTE